MLGPVTYDKSTGEWRCVIDAFATLVAPTKDELESAMDRVADYIRSRDRFIVADAVASCE